MNLPVIHEVTTAFKSAGKAIVGDTDGAREEWESYAAKSIVGSSIYAAVEACKGNESHAHDLIEGVGRAAANPLGGLGGTIPLFHEVNTALDSLGDALFADTSKARERWERYAENSVVGSGVFAAVEAANGNIERARDLGVAMGRATGAAAVGIAATAVSIGTAGAVAPLGVAVAAVAGGASGAAIATCASAGTKAIYNQPIEAGDLVGDALLGGAMAAAGAGIKARQFKINAKNANLARNLKMADAVADNLDGVNRNRPGIAAVAEDGNGNVRVGVNNGMRARNGLPRQEIHGPHQPQHPANMNPVANNGAAGVRPFQQCAEFQAFENLDGIQPKNMIAVQKGIGAKPNIVRAPCNNCAAQHAAGNYGVAPLAKFDGAPVPEVLGKLLRQRNANAVVGYIPKMSSAAEKKENGNKLKNQQVLSVESVAPVKSVPIKSVMAKNVSVKS
ncbi:hypothetical protein HDU79_011169, partial [Rhizoclosmatium sp. JEL0117]